MAKKAKGKSGIARQIESTRKKIAAIAKKEREKKAAKKALSTLNKLKNKLKTKQKSVRSKR